MSFFLLSELKKFELPYLAFEGTTLSDADIASNVYLLSADKPGVGRAASRLCAVYARVGDAAVFRIGVVVPRDGNDEFDTAWTVGSIAHDNCVFFDTSCKFQTNHIKVF